MTVVINGTTGITSVNGTAGAPSVTGTDTDTGIVYGTNTLSLATGGTTAVTVDSSQNVGIGTSSPVQKLHVNSASTGGIQVTNGTTGATSTDGVWIGIDSSGEAYFYNYENTGTRFYTNATEVGRFTSAGVFYMNSGYGSSAAAYGCRAWVNFNGTGTVAIRASGNVSSITDYAVGTYGVNFTTAMPDTSYSAELSTGTNSSGGINASFLDSLATGSFAIYTYGVAGGGAGAYRDTANIYVAVFR